jgi:hypothetical protein
LALSNFGSCSYFYYWLYLYFVAKALALTFQVLLKKSVMPYFTKRLICRKTAVGGLNSYFSFARLLDNLCTQSYILVIYIVFYDYLWQSCGCIFLDIPPPI